MTEIGLARATGVLVDRARVTPSSRTEGRHRERPNACAEKPVVSYGLDGGTAVRFIAGDDRRSPDLCGAAARRPSRLAIRHPQQPIGL